MNDLKFAFRQLLKNLGFTAVAVLTLALGIGANTAFFSLISAVVLRPPQVRNAESLVWLYPSFAGQVERHMAGNRDPSADSTSRRAAPRSSVAATESDQEQDGDINLRRA